MANLITPFEVQKYSPAGSTYPTAQFCELIPQIEQDFARQCLGSELYQYLQDSLTPYPATATEYNPATTYNIDEIVIRNGCLFISETNGNTTDPLKATGDWSEFERFTTDGANQLWAGYLRRILALKVYTSSLTFSTWQSGSGGITVNAGDGVGIRSATRTEIFDLKNGMLNMVEVATGNMLEWLKNNGETLEIPLPPSCKNNCRTRGKHSRRWAWQY